MSYHFNKIEEKWQKYWADNQTFKASNDSEKPKYYVLDMFPYPSGAGLHVGHPLGYIASDIYARFKRHKGFNVLHPQGYDSFGLPAEQYAIQTGQHPAVTTENNIARYREQLDKIGFSFDWSREVRTSEPDYYKWTQWIFIQLFESWYDQEAEKSRAITELEEIFTSEGNSRINAASDDDVEKFSADDWNACSEDEKEQILLKYRLTYLAEAEVNWCPQLGTVLANDEIVNGVSERGGYPVVRKKMTQWSMRISAFSERLLQDLNKIDWTESLKESQRNWIGKSVGAHVDFKIENSKFKIGVFTTRPDTIFGVSFMTLAPEHELVEKITTEDRKEEVQAYIEASAKRSERERMADVKTISGAFTGAYAEHPFTKKPVPIWIGDYVLAGYGTGAVMAVPCGDQRDHDFARHFDLLIPNIFENVDVSQEAYAGKEGTVIANSDFLSGLEYKEALNKVILELEKTGQGYGKTNYRLRDAVFSRQRYWGEPFPVYYVNGLPKMIDEKYLPLKLPEVEKYLPTETGEPPLGNATDWAWDSKNNKVVSNKVLKQSRKLSGQHDEPNSNVTPSAVEGSDDNGIYPLELNTMPGWAGSSWYLFRYMGAGNPDRFVSEEAQKYWENVDLYIGGSEHATGHLLYSRFWTKFLYDRGWLTVEEPFKKLINQGMILGTSAFVYRLEGENVFVSKNQINGNNVQPIHADVSLVNSSDELDIEGFKKWRPEFADAKFLTEDGKYIVGREVEKMSKSKYNVVNPDEICQDYGADTLRMYEMFLGPLEQAKPWNTAGITGVHNFLKKLWKLYYDGEEFFVSDEKASADSLKTFHKTIKKVTEDIEEFSFNTSVSTFMICVNELTAQKCNSREILEPLAVLIAPYAPHIAEELWEKLGNSESVTTAKYPEFEEKYLVESMKNYPVSFNGKMRFTMELSLDMSKEEIEKTVMADERTQKQLDGRTPKKVIVVPGKIVNIVG
ncbi:leucine--tRNA ligase [Christiangramia forsetii]|uniref:Leucine--tRNA ligase n=2 Tax=Christiangramia forsetii TaxID=411153 RepID=SYL_CHRFK|nr:class I tRNA ligase family protein [Christiangramia forsetii]A0M5T1.1 RecName: Full=Leucine--tRNA ligase; AltName: Full=Leucyl-tRNA synthetase; Short=LeuRS [Christiangramia forsetii KT0803]GGG32242.1 leucine--tRNA ligase [Christiangramia forsetii]CAL67976.1 leucyl-tRNA synthetase [Christiangramia forsetii KT0803]